MFAISTIEHVLSVLETVEVFLELAAGRLGGPAARWIVIVAVQVLKLQNITVQRLLEGGEGGAAAGAAPQDRPAAAPPPRPAPRPGRRAAPSGLVPSPAQLQTARLWQGHTQVFTEMTVSVLYNIIQPGRQPRQSGSPGLEPAPAATTGARGGTGQQGAGGGATLHAAATSSFSGIHFTYLLSEVDTV